MKIKRMYEMSRVEFTQTVNADGKVSCLLKIIWKPTKHNRLGTQYEVTYIVKDLADAQWYVDTIHKKK